MREFEQMAITYDSVDAFFALLAKWDREGACARSHSDLQSASLLSFRALLDRSNSGVPFSERAASLDGLRRFHLNGSESRTAEALKLTSDRAALSSPSLLASSFKSNCGLRPRNTTIWSRL